MSCPYDIRTKPIEQCATEVVDIGSQKYVDWQPGNGTRYALLFVRIDPQVKKDESGDWQITWLTKRRTMFVSTSSCVMYTYVKEKMSGIQDSIGTSDAICIAEAIGYILGLQSTTCEEFDPSLPAREVMES